MLIRQRLLHITFVTCGVAALPWLRVVASGSNPLSNATTAFRIVDDRGREVTLHGANVENEERSLSPPTGVQRPVDPAAYADGACPLNDGGYQEPPICEVGAGAGKFAINATDLSLNDFAQLRALGMNFIRLCISWSKLEEEPGVYSTMYIDRLEQIVSWAEEQDVYVLLDMHQDDYSRFIIGNQSDAVPPYLTPSDGQDGAPLWAVVTDGWPAVAIEGVGEHVWQCDLFSCSIVGLRVHTSFRCPYTLPSPAHFLAAEGNMNLAVLAAFDNFWTNRIVNVSQGEAPGPGLQDHYIGAVAALARRFINSSAVVGFELFNEPQPGFEQIDPVGFGETLSGFYARVIQAITGVRDGLPTCNGTGLRPPPPNSSTAACAYPDLGIHDNRHLFFTEPSALRNELDFAPEVSAPFTTYSGVVYSPHVYTGSFTLWNPPSFDYAYETATAEANARHAALVVTEFGCAFTEAARLLEPTLVGQEAHLISGSSFWSWKSNCVGDGCPSSWTIFDTPPSNGSGPIAYPNGKLRPLMEQLLSRPHPRGLVGVRTVSSYNTTTRAFSLTATYSGNASGLVAAYAAAELRSPQLVKVSALDDARAVTATLSVNQSLTELYIPRGVEGIINVTGAAALSSVASWPDGSRTAFVAPSGLGTYTITISPTSANVGSRDLGSDLPLPSPQTRAADHHHARTVAAAAAKSIATTATDALADVVAMRARAVDAGISAAARTS